MSRPATLASLLTGLVMLTTLPGCGGADPSNSTGQAVAGDARRQSQGLASAGTVSALDAVRLANQASMGPSEALLAEIQAAGTPAAWIKAQMKLDVSRYRSGGTEAVHKNVDELGYCGQPSQVGNVHCWRDNFSTEPLAWDFYRNATTQPDQLRQRVALALHQFLVVSGHEIGGTYGLRNYQNNFLSLAFGNYRDVLRKVILSPVMGDYLDHVNNDKAAPNENFARELLQLFSLGNCQLNRSATLVGGKCAAVYDNAMVRNYAYALTGWTYPKGGSASWGCWPEGAHCQYYAGDMVPAPKLRNKKPRTLLSGVAVADGADSATALDAVLNSLMAHANLAPFVARQLVQQLVSSNPSPEYVKRVATAFEAGKFKFGPEGSTVSFGTGVKGDLAATVAAALLDPEAR
ncbi:DUF1800 family protein, partial [Ideonella sp.]|uniref:DUF1800 family protein n=1 Tax=Ideonella sp. TaxID=1929293 RepID=UPI003BB73563